MFEKRRESSRLPHDIFHSLQLPPEVEKRDHQAILVSFVQALHCVTSSEPGCVRARSGFINYSSSRPSVGFKSEPATAVSNCGISSSAKGASGNKWRGRKIALAIIVGMTALAITAATKKEYCSGVTNSCVSPYKADIVPNVRPVDIKSV